MKKTDNFTKTIAVVMFAAAALYLFGWLWRSTHENMVTAPVEAVTITDSAQADGIAVREETLLTADKQYISVQAEDGKAVAKGAVLAVSMNSEAALSRMNHIAELKLEIQSLTAVLSGASSSESDAAARDADIRAAVLALSGSVARHDLTGVASSSMDLSTLVFQQDSAADGQSQLAALSKELAGLQSSGSGETADIKAAAPGIFTRNADGYEDLTPKSLENLTVSGLSAIFASRQPVASSVFGKLVTDAKWYFAADLDTAHAAMLTVGKTAYLEFPRYYNDRIPVKVESVSPADGGKCAVVFSCERALSDTLSMRRATAEILFSEVSGLRVPLKSVHVDEDGSYVYCLTAQRVEKKYVDILSTEDDCYIVSVGSEANSLRENDTLIVSGKDIYKGKVVDP